MLVSLNATHSCSVSEEKFNTSAEKGVLVYRIWKMQDVFCEKLALIVDCWNPGPMKTESLSESWSNKRRFSRISISFRNTEHVAVFAGGRSWKTDSAAPPLRPLATPPQLVPHAAPSLNLGGGLQAFGGRLWNVGDSC